MRVVYGDTAIVPFNLVGTGGSRAATLASGAVLGAAAAVRRRLLDLAAERWRSILRTSNWSTAAPGRGRAEPGGPDRRNSPQPPSPAPGSRIGGRHRRDRRDGTPSSPATGTWSQATHLCVVEVDIDTGLVTIPRYLVVEDCGPMINPAIVDGQIRGGVAQGIGAVLLERSAYGADGQYLAATLMDYLLPTSLDVPPIEIHHLEHEPDTSIGPDGAPAVPYRGVGEGGAIGAPAALTNAIEDALRPVRRRDRRATPPAAPDPRAVRPDRTGVLMPTTPRGVVDPEVAARYRAAGWWADESLADRLVELAETSPDAPAYVTATTSMSWSELLAAARRVAAAVAAGGAGPGERVAVMLPDGPTVHAVFLGIELAGATIVGIGARAGTAEIRHLLTKTGATQLITHGEHRSRPASELVGEIAGEVPHLAHHLVVPRFDVDPLGALVLDGAAVDGSAAIDAADRRLGPDDLWSDQLDLRARPGCRSASMHTQNRWRVLPPAGGDERRAHRPTTCS